MLNKFEAVQNKKIRSPLGGHQPAVREAPPPLRRDRDAAFCSVPPCPPAMHLKCPGVGLALQLTATPLENRLQAAEFAATPTGLLYVSKQDPRPLLAQTRQWLEFLRLIGVQRVYFVGFDEEAARIVWPYVEAGLAVYYPQSILDYVGPVQVCGVCSLRRC